MNADRYSITEREIIVARDFEADAEALFRAWCEPAWIERWWAPPGFRTRVVSWDATVGGEWSVAVTDPERTVWRLRGEFLALEPSARIVTTDGFEGPAEARPVGDTLRTALFEERRGRTELELRIEHPGAIERRAHEALGAAAGWHASFDRLERCLSSPRDDR